MTCTQYEKLEMDALVQLWTVTWDGDLISKDARDKLVDGGLAQRVSGYNWLTHDGVLVAKNILFLRGHGDPVSGYRP